VVEAEQLLLRGRPLPDEEKVVEAEQLEAEQLEAEQLLLRKVLHHGGAGAATAVPVP
jgi:hypothetical protein